MVIMVLLASTPEVQELAVVEAEVVQTLMLARLPVAQVAQVVQESYFQISLLGELHQATLLLVEPMADILPEVVAEAARLREALEELAEARQVVQARRERLDSPILAEAEAGEVGQMAIRR
jgi:hypothetical protein